MVMSKSPRKRRSASATNTPATSVPSLDWTQMIGQQAPQAAMLQAFQRQRLPQVLLLEGRVGIGKRRLAAYAAALWLCQERRACGTCGACRACMNLSHPEILWIEPEDGVAISISSVDLLLEHLSFSPEQRGSAGATARVAVLTDIDGLTVQAANRLLKTLEEPSPHAFVVLTTARPRRLLPTILSRTVRWRVAPPKLEESLAWLQQQPGVVRDPDGLKQLLRRCALSPGMAWRRLQSDASLTLDAESFQQLLGANAADAVRLGAQLAKGSGVSAASIAEHYEIVLNEYYRGLLTAGRLVPGALNPLSLAKRRQLLSAVHRGAGHKKIALNNQMTAESLGLLAPDSVG